MSAHDLESYLAQLYTDAAERTLFLANPQIAAIAAGLDEDCATALADIDKTGLVMAAASYAHKRTQHRRSKQSVYAALRLWWRGR